MAYIEVKIAEAVTLDPCQLTNVGKKFSIFSSDIWLENTLNC